MDSNIKNSNAFPTMKILVTVIVGAVGFALMLYVMWNLKYNGSTQSSSEDFSSQLKKGGNLANGNETSVVTTKFASISVVSKTGADNNKPTAVVQPTAITPSDLLSPSEPPIKLNPADQPSSAPLPNKGVTGAANPEVIQCDHSDSPHFIKTIGDLVKDAKTPVDNPPIEPPVGISAENQFSEPHSATKMEQSKGRFAQFVDYIIAEFTCPPHEDDERVYPVRGEIDGDAVPSTVSEGLISTNIPVNNVIAA